MTLNVFRSWGIIERAGCGEIIAKTRQRASQHGTGLSAGCAQLLEMNIAHAHVTVSETILDCRGEGLRYARFVKIPGDAQQRIDAYIDSRR